MGKVIMHVADKETLDEANANTKAILAAVDENTRVKSIKRYGVKINKNDSNPTTRVTYILDAVGMTPAAMNYSTGKFSYGDWADKWFIKQNYPCMLKYDGTEAYRLNPDDYSKKEDGTASDIANASFGGNAMSSIPLVWLSQFEIGDYEYIIVSEERYDESYHAYAHTREDGSIMEKYYSAIFRGTYDGTRLRSISGLQPMYNTSAQTEINRAKANGELWNTRTWAQRNLILSLLVIIGKCDNLQTTFGNGNLGYDSSAENPTHGVMQTGALNTAGQFMGYNDNTHQVKVFHMEAPWADQWERLQGMILNKGVLLVKMTPPYNLTGAGFEDTGVRWNSDASAGGYWKTAKCCKLGRLPFTTGGSSSTYHCDYFYYNGSIVAVVLSGGNCSNGTNCGSYLGLSNSAGDANWSIGASLSSEQPLAA